MLLNRPPLRDLLLPATLFIVCLAACKESSTGDERTDRREVVGNRHELFKTDDFRQRLVTLMPAADSTDSTVHKKTGVINAAAGMHLAYTLAHHAPFWVTERGVSTAAQTLLTELDSLKNEGLNPGRYHLSDLKKKFEALSHSGGSLEDAIAFDTACTYAYLQASRDLLMGAVPVKSADSLWYHSNDSAWQAPTMLAATLKGGDYVPLSAFRSAIPTYGMLRQAYIRYTSLAGDASLKSLKASVSGKTIADSTARKIIAIEAPWVKPAAGDSLPEGRQYIRGFQEYFGLNPTGKTDSMTIRLLARQPDSLLPVIAANMERIRWLPRSLESQYVIVNIPLMELFYRKDGRDDFNMRVVVGKPARQTPVLNAMMANVVFSPGWGVPPTILKNDVLPGIARRGGSYLARKGLHAFDHRGRMVSAGAVTAKNYRNFNFRQLPGEHNALGEVKFNLPNQWDIYLHDTPHREDFVKYYRAKSSGCIRLQHPKEFAQFILEDLEGRNFDPLKIDSIIDTRKTRFENLKTKIPVHILYLTAFEDNNAGHLRFLPDIYRRDKKVIAALQQAGAI